MSCSFTGKLLLVLPGTLCCSALCDELFFFYSSLTERLEQYNFLSVANNPYGPWSKPVPVDAPLDAAVPPFVMSGVPNRNSNLILSIARNGSMVGLWRRCCDPPPKYKPPTGGNGASVIFGLRASNWSDIATWRAGDVALFPDLRANGYEDPHIYPDFNNPGVFHALFHDMEGGWHGPEFNNTQVGAHAYSADGGLTWINTGVAFNTTVEYTDGTRIDFIQRERPHIVLDSRGNPAFLTSGVTYAILQETLPTCTIVQPIATSP